MREWESERRYFWKFQCQGKRKIDFCERKVVLWFSATVEDWKTVAICLENTQRNLWKLSVVRLKRHRHVCMSASFMNAWRKHKNPFSQKRLDYSNRSTLALESRRDLFAFLVCKAIFFLFVFEREAGVDISSSYIFLTRWWHKKNKLRFFLWFSRCLFFRKKNIKISRE